MWTIKAKFHYASWFEADSKLVADRFEAGRRQATNLSVISFEPASVMEFGFSGEWFGAREFKGLNEPIHRY